MDDDLSYNELVSIASDPRIQNIVSEQGGFPDAPEKESLMKFFKEIISFKDKDFDELSRTGNLKDGEIGYLGLPVRNYLSLARFADSEGFSKVRDYLNVKSNIMVGTSLSRKAALLNFAVTQKRVSKSLGASTKEVKTGMFGSTEKVSGGDDL